MQSPNGRRGDDGQQDGHGDFGPSFKDQTRDYQPPVGTPSPPQTHPEQDEAAAAQAGVGLTAFDPRARNNKNPPTQVVVPIADAVPTERTTTRQRSDSDSDIVHEHAVQEEPVIPLLQTTKGKVIVGLAACLVVLGVVLGGVCGAGKCKQEPEDNNGFDCSALGCIYTGDDGSYPFDATPSFLVAHCFEQSFTVPTQENCGCAVHLGRTIAESKVCESCSFRNTPDGDWVIVFDCSNVLSGPCVGRDENLQCIPSTPVPTPPPSSVPTPPPSSEPTPSPSSGPTPSLASKSTPPPTSPPSTTAPTRSPTRDPTKLPTKAPTFPPSTTTPTRSPTRDPTKMPTKAPTLPPSTTNQRTVWVSPLRAFPSGSRSKLLLDRGSSGDTLRVTTTEVGDQWLALPLDLSSLLTVTKITLCYRLSRSASFISQIRLTEENEPPTAFVKHDDGTDLTDVGPTCATSDVYGLKPSGAIVLSLRFFFATLDDTIELGGIGIDLSGVETDNEDQTLWISPLAGSVKGNNLLLDRGSSGTTLKISSTAVGDLQWVNFPVQISNLARIKQIILCYALSSTGSFISQIRLAQQNEPPQATVVHDDGKDLKSLSPVCVASAVTGLQPSGALSLSLRLNFGSTSDTIDIGALGLVFAKSEASEEDKQVWINPIVGIPSPSSGLMIENSLSVGSRFRIKTSRVGDLQWVSFPFYSSSVETIRLIGLCYRLSSAGSFISQVRLTEENEPPSALVRHDDPTDLTRTSPVCVTSAVGNLKPSGTVTLSLRLNFADVNDYIDIGAISIRVESV